MTYWIIWRKVSLRGEDVAYFQCANGQQGSDYPYMYPTKVSAVRDMAWLIKNQPELGWHVKEITFG